jgi:hypothetical protein
MSLKSILVARHTAGGLHVSPHPSRMHARLFGIIQGASLVCAKKNLFARKTLRPQAAEFLIPGSALPGGASVEIHVGVP